MKLPTDQKFFVFDCESVGLRGQTFAVAGGVYDIAGTPLLEFAFYCQPGRAKGVGAGTETEAGDRNWVAASVTIPQGAEHFDYPETVRLRFWNEWMKAKKNFPTILMFVECGWPVEARFLIECIGDDPVTRNWEGPYPCHEIATLMLAAGMDPMATYDRLPSEQPAHDPLADARLSARLLSVALGRLDEAYQHTIQIEPELEILHIDE